MKGIETTDTRRQLERLFRVGTVVGMTDPQLLEQFVAGDADSAGSAFEAIVERHGPMILRICHSVLRDSHAAEDAFQATFLVLARKARALGSPDLLGNWLYGVALRTARKAKALAVRRRVHDRNVALLRSVATADTASDPSQADIEQVVHDEINRLPRPYRAVVVVCYFEGMSQMEAARQLCLTETTVRGRLARARKLLGKRLMRRGVMPSVGLVSLENASGTSLRIPGMIAQATARAALVFAKRGKAMPGALSGTAHGLANGVLATMWFTSLKTIASALIAVAFLVAGAALVAQQPSETRHQVGLPQADYDAEITSEPLPLARATAPKSAQVQVKKKGQRQAPAVSLDPDLVKAAVGPIIQAIPISQDVSIIAYLPNQNLGHVDNMAIQNSGGGVRVLLDWPPIPGDDADSNDRRYLIALYSKKTHSNPPAGRIHAFELLEGWREMTSWSTQPRYDPEPVASFRFEPSDGWKLFDITPLVRDQTKAGRQSHGILLRFLSEDAPGNALSGYDVVSREGGGQWANRHPVLLVSKANKS
jgi:RNA polymerase sigma factor (sigma-70 family)